ncbi:MFS general substrate transporter [Eremomyces bilateralis CBS 781.70]|uniref:MFS general substrate transporter n=1 Tax=Eremomyces bilateralis CBS 781.70 TaxID=1392243 RepID=A0A6G1G2S5_9PEZI|nr:MFS general substrate transporter [Eremomyces bilateralis CBS 781.70]KAF1812231.1 MFS general substrate transporter [Eremomyces bilateralis CBS 781.70]
MSGNLADGTKSGDKIESPLIPIQDTPQPKSNVSESTSTIQEKPHTSTISGVDLEPSNRDQPWTGQLKKAWSSVVWFVTWTPPRCRWDPEKPPTFSIGLNVLFAFAAAFSVANLYYTHPILNVLAADFGVPYEKVSQIPTVMQAGYAAGLLFLCPLGDLLRRRHFVLGLVFLTATLWIVLCVTKSLTLFTAISFITSVTTVTPQLALPLVGDLAPPERRAAALSIVVSGLMLGILIARVVSGTMTNFTSWRNVYWMALGLQYSILVLLWLFMPDYPSTNPDGLNYFYMLWSIVQMVCQHPVLVQACLIGFFSSATFTNFWTVVTFLLSGSPYFYSPLVIGLFGLIGVAVMILGPLYARLVTDRFVPLFSVLVGISLALVGIIIGTYTGTITVAGPIIHAILNDFGMQTTQIANRSAIYSIEPKARNRLNTAFMVSVFCGQLTGTSAGSHLYAAGGWIRSGSASVGFVCAALLIALVRGPHEKGWIGWGGGFGLRNKKEPITDISLRNDSSEGESLPVEVEVCEDMEKGAVGKKE